MRYISLLEAPSLLRNKLVVLNSSEYTLKLSTRQEQCYSGHMNRVGICYFKELSGCGGAFTVLKSISETQRTLKDVVCCVIDFEDFEECGEKVRMPYRAERVGILECSIDVE